MATQHLVDAAVEVADGGRLRGRWADGAAPGELACFQRGLELRRRAGDERGVAESLFQVGLVHQVIRDDSAAALPWFEEAYTRARKAADPVLMSYAIRHVAFCRLHAGDRAGARAGLEESLWLREQAGFIPGVAMALAALAEVVASDGQRQDAVALLGGAGDLRVAGRRRAHGLGGPAARRHAGRPALRDGPACDPADAQQPLTSRPSDQPHAGASRRGAQDRPQLWPLIHRSGHSAPSSLRPHQKS